MSGEPKVDISLPGSTPLPNKTNGLRTVIERAREIEKERKSKRPNENRPLTRKHAVSAAMLEHQGQKLEEASSDRDEAARNANIDALTGLPNRRAFDESVNQLVIDGERCGVLLLDIDRFKSFNDMFGHKIGDKALVKLARSIALTTTSLDIVASVRAGPTEEDSTRQPDSVFRWGGEEFAVLLRGVSDIEILRTITERIRVAVEKDPHAINIEGMETPIPMTISAGGALFDGGSLSDFEKCISKADENLYFAKRDGRNRSVVS